MKIYVVYNEGGEYNDSCGYFVCSYFSEQRAKERVAKLNSIGYDDCYYYIDLPIEDAEGDHHES